MYKNGFSYFEAKVCFKIKPYKNTETLKARNEQCSFIKTSALLQVVFFENFVLLVFLILVVLKKSCLAWRENRI
jgi:hypothetical protein